MATPDQIPCSPLLETDGIIYFPRLCDKVRLMGKGTLHPDFHANLGAGYDRWTCEFLGVSYDDLKTQILSGATDQEALAWARQNGNPRTEVETTWWLAYMKTRGFRDDLAQRLAERKKEAPHTDRDDILTFMDYIEADEGRLTGTEADLPTSPLSP